MNDLIRPLLDAPTVDLPTAAAALGLGSRSAAYEALANGTWPTPVIRIGRRIFVPTAPVLALLGLDGSGADPPDAAAGRRVVKLRTQLAEHRGGDGGAVA